MQSASGGHFSKEPADSQLNKMKHMFVFQFAEVAEATLPPSVNQQYLHSHHFPTAAHRLNRLGLWGILP